MWNDLADLARFNLVSTPFDSTEFGRYAHVLFVFPKVENIHDLTSYVGIDYLHRILIRKQVKLKSLLQEPLTGEMPNGALVSWMMIDPQEQQSVFSTLTHLRQALKPLLAEHPQTLALVIADGFSPAHKRILAEQLLYITWLNQWSLPHQKSKKEKTAQLNHIGVFGLSLQDETMQPDAQAMRALAQGNNLCRYLTALPSNELTPIAYIRKVSQLAKEQGWSYVEYDTKQLKKWQAGAFLTVTQGSKQAGSLVHLTYRPKVETTTPLKRIVLVGKGICFDTGGHQLKPARYMQHMNEDMNGSAVVLGILHAVTALQLPVQIDAWLAIAQNYLSPEAYKPQDVVTAANGTTIEIIHTDAEGRMVLADALAFATGNTKQPLKETASQPIDLLIDYATLTGSCITALGTRYSGLFTRNTKLAHLAYQASRLSGERVSSFPLDDDYDKALESKIADVKQCILEGEADHILAVKFLERFVPKKTPWIHLDLSASRHEEGLGAVGTDITGFGVAWTIDLLMLLIGSSSSSHNE